MDRDASPPFCWISPTPESTLSAAAALAAVIERERRETLCTIGLRGALGAGKTAFVQGLASGFGFDPVQVSSPTFTICNEYPLAGGGVLAHLDLYRIESEGELEATGFLDLLEPGNVLAVE